ncbi:MAG: nucleotidyltransferase domain-containing protein [Oscillospiraceae bacterium]|nr:nucleotidyltransferase domain-containing protein [Oscillospiraceae bacterium]
MNNELKQKLMDKNQKLIEMVIERVKRDFPDDIAIIGLSGSFSTDDYHEKSDLDLIIINNTEHAWEISECFIFDDVGYDIYCTPWESRIEAQSNLNSEMISCLIDLKIIYCAKPEYMKRFNAYKQKALHLLAKPIGKECLEQAKKYIYKAKQHYAEAMISDDLGIVRFASCGVMYYLINAIVRMNNTYIKRGIKRYREEILSYKYLPEKFYEIYMSVIEANTIIEMRNTSLKMLKNVVILYDDMYEKFVEKQIPTYENLEGTYEELWSNCRNKVILSCDLGDKSYAYHAAMGAQNYFDEMTKMIGTKKIDLMQYFAANNLQLFKKEFLHAMDEYLEEYNKVGKKVIKFDTFEELYEFFMKK